MMRRRAVGLGLGLGLAGLLSSCGFTAGSSLNQCQDTIPAACGSTAHCVLDSDQYLSGEFPGSQTFIVRTTMPQTLTFQFVFQNRVSPGTQLSLTSTEPDCAAQSSYMSQGDLFQLAGPSGVLSFQIEMMTAGDHLVQFNSDAYCSYELRYQ
jgi:hypothetical protein